MNHTADTLNHWIELSAAAHRHNLAFFRDLVGPRVELSAVVKANAYGHGLAPMARLAIAHGADSFCVHTLDEALSLRRLGVEQDILILGRVHPARAGEVPSHDLRVVVYDETLLDALATAAESQGRTARVHLKVETGTCRQGVEGAVLDRLAERTVSSPGTVLDGLYTHFADIEDTTDPAFARSQLDRFRRERDRLAERGFEPARVHAACSAAILVHESTHFDMVRLGIGQYGFWSSPETLLSFRARHGEAGTAAGPRPVLTWKCRISQLKWVPRDARVGYGGTWEATRPTRLAILPVGYSDGYDRGLSNIGQVSIRGRRAPVRGRVCMNLLMVDVTDIEGVEVDDEVELLGPGRGLGAEAMASRLDTISYEVVARLGAHIPRLVVD